MTATETRTSAAPEPTRTLEAMSRLAGELRQLADDLTTRVRVESVANVVITASYNASAVAELLGVQPNTVAGWVHQGDLQHFRVRRRIMIPAKDLARFVHRHPLSRHAKQLWSTGPEPQAAVQLQLVWPGDTELASPVPGAYLLYPIIVTQREARTQCSQLAHVRGIDVVARSSDDHWLSEPAWRRDAELAVDHLNNLRAALRKLAKRST